MEQNYLRPLFGVSLFLLKGLQNWNVSNGKFSSPLRGISISTGMSEKDIEKLIVFVPSSGYLYFYYDNL